MSKTPVETSVDAKVRVAFHLSNVPWIATDASTSKLTLLSTGVTSNTGTPELACARVAGENKTDAKMQRTANRMDYLLHGDETSARLVSLAGAHIRPTVRSYRPLGWGARRLVS
jgi:hypothetical protein